MTVGSWSIAVFTSREEPDTLKKSLSAVIAASASRPTTIDVLVDNNPRTAAALEPWTPTDLASGSTLRLWLVPWRDKACAWNRYVHEIAPAAEVAFFVDGYARPRPDSLLALERALDAAPEAWAASAVPTVGRSAPALRATMFAEGGLHGSVYALRSSVVEHFRQRGFRLPLGLYRNDSLIGAVASFAGDPARQSWDPKRRIAVAADATWDNDIPTMGPRRIVAWVRRRLRQAQGELENAAFRQHLAIGRQSPETLPETVQGLLAALPATAVARRGPVQRLLLRSAARRMAQPVDWSRCGAPAALLRTWKGASPTVT